MRLADVIADWIGKFEIVVAGADEDLREGQDALAAGDPMRARAAAHRVLGRAPESPIGLALLADACGAAGLDAELTLTLEELARRAPSRAEVWVRLGRARRATASPPGDVRDAFVRALAVAESGSEARRDALLELADLDLAQGDGARAELWLERAADDKAPDVAARRAEARLLRGDASGAQTLLASIDAPATDGRVALARGRAFAALGDATALPSLVRAMVLDAPGASDALSSALGHVPSDEQVRARVRSVVDAKDEQALARWRAAFARAEGARGAARQALRDAVDAGDTAAARPLLDAAIDDQDRASLAVALRALPAQDADPLLADARLVASGSVDDVARVRHPRVVPWARAVAEEAARAWLPAGASADWPDLLARLDAHARALADLDAVAAVASLAVERARPVRLAIVGEFNAGKSTFINALIGADVAPTGVLPTTATLHHLRWAPDPIARIHFVSGHEPPERIVPLPDLRATLKALDGATVRRVELLIALPFLMRVEILDTPGFNAPDAHHAALARAAFEEADVAVWLLDGTQAMKASERAVLDEARRAGLPVQMLVNKADRLAGDDLARVRDGGGRGGARARPASRRSAAARAVGRRKRSRASWGTLRRSSSPAGRRCRRSWTTGSSRAARSSRSARCVGARRAWSIASWRRRPRGRTRSGTRTARRAAQAQATGHAAARIERDAEPLAVALAGSLEPHARAWARDLDLVFVGRDRRAADADPVLVRYRVDRALASVAPPLARALASLAPEAGQSPAQLTPLVRALVRATASTAPSDPAALLAPLTRAAIATLVEQLFASSVPTPGESHAPGMLRELQAIAASLAT